MKKINQKNASYLLIFLNSILFILIQTTGYISENEMLEKVIIIPAFIFILLLLLVIYYKNNHKTISFWVLIALGIITILLLMAFIYITALGSAFQH